MFDCICDGRCGKHHAQLVPRQYSFILSLRFTKDIRAPTVMVFLCDDIWENSSRRIRRDAHFRAQLCAEEIFHGT